MSEKSKEEIKAAKAVAGLGVVASGIGIAAAATATTGVISAAGTVIGGVAGSIVGSTIGIATGGTAIAGTIPVAIAGSALGSHLGTAAAFFGIGTAPFWAVPLAVVGGIIAVGSLISIHSSKK